VYYWKQRSKAEKPRILLVVSLYAAIHMDENSARGN